MPASMLSGVESVSSRKALENRSQTGGIPVARPLAVDDDSSAQAQGLAAVPLTERAAD